MAALLAHLSVADGTRALFWSVGAAKGEGAPLDVRVTDGARLWAGSLGTEDLKSVVSDEKTEGCTLAEKARHWCSDKDYYLFKLDEFAAPPLLTVLKRVGASRIGVASIKLAEAGDPARGARMVELLTCCVDAVASQAARAESLQVRLTAMEQAFDKVRTRVGDKNQALAAEREELASNFLAVFNAHKKEMCKLRRKLRRHNVAVRLGEAGEEEEAEAENDSDSDSDDDSDDDSQASRRSSDEEVEQDERAISAGKLAPRAAAAATSATPAYEQRPDKKPKTASAAQAAAAAKSATPANEQRQKKPKTAAQCIDTELGEAKKDAPLHWTVCRSDKPGDPNPFRYCFNVFCVVQDTTSDPLHHVVRHNKRPVGVNDQGLPTAVSDFVRQHSAVGVELHYDKSIPDERAELVKEARGRALNARAELSTEARTAYLDDKDGLWPS
jgi:hypothetical protein